MSDSHIHSVPGSVDKRPLAVTEVIEIELNEGAFEVPLLPQTASEVLATTLDDGSDAMRLAELIEKDQSLAAHVLRVVNSPAFRGSSEIVALKQAIARLGMARIGEIALSVSLKGTVFSAGPFQSLIEQSWSYSLRSALWAKEVARASRKNVEIAYLCGLLHDMGQPIVINRCVALQPDIAQDTLVSAVDMLQQRVGLLLVQAWSLPEVVSTCIAHSGNFASELPDREMLAIVDAARVMATLQTADKFELDTLVQTPALQFLNFYPDDLEALALLTEQVDAAVESMR